MRPLGKLDLRHEFGLHPVHTGCIDRTVKRTAIGFQLFEQLPDFLEHRLVESRSRLPHVNEAPFLVIEPKDDRAEVLPAAFRVGVTPDHAVDCLRNLDLEPLAGAAFFITTAALFRENPLQPVFSRSLKELQTLGEMIGIADQVAALNNLREDLLTLLERNPAQIVTVDIEQIEKVIHDLQLTSSSGSSSTLANAGTLLHQAEGSTALLVERNHFTVENSIFRFDQPGEVTKLRKFASEV